jgi:hypothetical protein
MPAVRGLKNRAHIAGRIDYGSAGRGVETPRSNPESKNPAMWAQMVVEVKP